MTTLILADNTVYEIKEESSVGDIRMEVENYGAMETLSRKMSKENLEKVQFKTDGIVTGEYRNMALCDPNYLITEKAGRLQVIFGLREMTGEELHQDHLEAALSYLTDEEAVTVADLHQEWQPYTAYSIGERKLYEKNLYRCRQNHRSEAQYTPDLVPALWDIIHPADYGTIDNPVIVPNQVSSMVYIKGRYYLDEGILYLMNREGMKDGEEVSLAYRPSQLVGQYFEIVKR